MQATIEAGAILYLEGYLWNAEQSRDAMKRAIAMARGAGRKVALTLSDVFVVEGHRDEFFALIDAGQIDMLFANDNEVRAMMQDEDIEAAVAALSARVPTAGLHARRGRAPKRTRAASMPASPPSRSTTWSTRPARATCSPPASSRGRRRAATSRRACAWARSAPPNASRTSARGRSPTSRRWSPSKLG